MVDLTNWHQDLDSLVLQLHMSIGKSEKVTEDNPDIVGLARWISRRTDATENEIAHEILEYLHENHID
jgi:hypothetical protein